MRKYPAIQYSSIDTIEDCMDALSMIETRLPTHQQLMRVKELVSFEHAFYMCSQLLDTSQEVDIQIWGCYMRKSTVHPASTTQLADGSGLIMFLDNAEEHQRVVLRHLMSDLFEGVEGSVPKQVLQHIYGVQLPMSISNLDMRCLIFFNHMEPFMKSKDGEYERSLEYLATRCAEYFIRANKTKAKVSWNISFEFSL